MGLIGYRLQDGQKKYCLYDSSIRSDILAAHPAKFSPEDEFSKYRIEYKQQTKQLFNNSDSNSD
ncbi:H/ACA ribonucleoprotein complex subunit 3 [Nematocida homosporus]|uniref:H/ACA ribonucleoprotein complex subunit 3 n=1 Tax=Nematocida homosporus TaxID=1912981 RepID=UPI00221F4592|nr:H/ACA ribonucleoprotein complex subunit 3 [Nematocida homosporus]KAI5186653.1 H/ACA ribonucleoprotein complex subunit 3 [Nematocida homosporus]